MRVLRLGETMESLLEDVRWKFNTLQPDGPTRLVYLGSATKKTGPGGYRKPGEGNYLPMAAIDLFLSPWCLRPTWGGENFDLVPALFLHLITPSVGNENHLTFPEGCGLSSYRQEVAVNPNSVPEELRPFIRETKHHRAQETYPAIKFHVSDYILVPTESRETWSRGVTIPPDSQVLQPPGQYTPEADRWPGGEKWNRYLRVERDPGDCILCGGASGERIHFGHVAWAPKAYGTGLVCRTCFPKFAEGILQALQ